MSECRLGTRTIRGLTVSIHTKLHVTSELGLAGQRQTDIACEDLW